MDSFEIATLIIVVAVVILAIFTKDKYDGEF